MQTFAVSDVTPSGKPLEPITLERAFESCLADPVEIEACGANQAHLVRAPGLVGTHPLIEAVHTAFAEHHPLVLSPDDVWLCLAQGFGLHVEANAEALRSRFVRHQGKLKLEVRRDDFVKGWPDNDWQGCFAEWSDAIAAHIGKKRDLVVASFSTTGPVERAASELVLMSAMKSYFDLTMVTLCGIPAITLLGTVEDWRAIRRRAEVFAEFDLADWVKVLLPVLDQFVAAASGKVDLKFWRSIYKHSDQSGGPYVTGWINVLFPYLNKIDILKRPDYSKIDLDALPSISRNHYALCWKQDMDDEFSGTTLGVFPRGLSHVPLTWQYLGASIPMTLLGGFVGISQDPQTGAVRSAIGWAVWEADTTRV